MFSDKPNCLSNSGVDAKCSGVATALYSVYHVT